jgi:Fic family protein
LEKLNEIQNPFEQSLFMLVFIPYFQIFLDINKRTSRMSSNLPLLKHNLPLISLLAVEKRTYINAILAVYELNDVSLLRDMFVENYLLNMKRYI